MRIALAVEYNGSAFCGWQRQPHCHSVQAEVEQALSKIANEAIVVHCSGRTDTGVHAAAQIIHFDTSSTRPIRAWTIGANTHLDRHVSIIWAKPVSDAFHARFKALNRSYRYSLLNRPTRPALKADRLGWVNQPLDASRMHAAAQQLLGTHDFSAFRSSACQARHAVRDMQHIAVSRHGAVVSIDITANGFLHNMVRIIAGCLIRIGKGDADAAWLNEIMVAGDRRAAGITAPPQGLCFVQATYPDEFGIPRFDSAIVDA